MFSSWVLDGVKSHMTKIISPTLASELAVGDGEPVVDLQQALRDFVQRNALLHAAYFAHRIPGRPPGEHVVATTYAPAWVRHYFEQEYFRIDPVVSIDRSTLLPVDWNSLDKSPKRIRQFFGEAAEFGVGRQGLAIPVRGPLGDRAIFAVTSDASAAEWEDIRRELMRDIVIAAQVFHQKAMSDLGLYELTDVRPLSRRELECLQWAAAGKTMQDIAVVVGISERMARAYLDSARYKLNAQNIAQAVARGVSHGLISAG